MWSRTMAKNDSMTSLRLPHDLVRQLDTVVAELERDQRYAATRITRGTVIRMALLEFLARRNDAMRPRRQRTDLDAMDYVFGSAH